MLDGFGLAPVCLDLDLDSYDGPAINVVRFRGREGWLVVAEASIESHHRRWRVPFAIGCDEYGNAIPDFMIPNLLACATSLPSPCTDIPPFELDELLEAAHDRTLRRWLRGQSDHLRDFHQRASDQITALERRTDLKLRAIEHEILSLQRSRRLARYDLETREEIDAAIFGLELKSENLMAELRGARINMRRALAEQEESLLETLEVSARFNRLYEIQWRGVHEGDVARDEVRDLVAELQRACLAGHFALGGDRRAHSSDEAQNETDEWFRTAVAQVRIWGYDRAADPSSDGREAQAVPAPRNVAPPRTSAAPRRPTPKSNSHAGKPARDVRSAQRKEMKPAEARKLAARLVQFIALERKALTAADKSAGSNWSRRLLKQATFYRRQIEILEAKLGTQVDAYGLTPVVTPAAHEAEPEHLVTAPTKPTCEGQECFDRGRAADQVAPAAEGWTDEQIAVLKVMWLEGASASTIAARMGNKSRNAVIGKAARLKLPSTPTNFSKTDRIKGATEAI
jgi:hypothetical protein